jgi:hypothetical protein
MTKRLLTFLFAGFLCWNVSAELTAKSYISDGLIAHWDGVFNVGYNAEHKADAASWTELTGNGPNLALPTGSSFAADALTTVRR